ncbi:MAG: chromate resistance protein [Deltaproteobacteria bacterium]|nr:chromate resistance protein [Deltaproteobacteria bacterium]MBI3389255.1 chromate resistance protein [Deltaproteobacteria bacterium]
MAKPSKARWLLLIHQLPPKPNYLRVKIWRRLQRVGAVAVKNSVYVLPCSEQAREDLEWTLREIAERGGDASICEARFVEGLSDEQLEGLFHAARDADYAQLAEDLRGLFKALPRGRDIGDDRRSQLETSLTRVERRFAEIATIDFFGAPGREVVDGLLASITQRAQAKPDGSAARSAPTARSVRGGTWVTRKGIHIDRMASAWLIRRFIDPTATFKFVPGKGYELGDGEIRFDMFQAEYTHEGDHCTFEVLVKRFHLEEPALRPIAEIVHDIDLKDAKFDRPEAAGIDHLVAGIAMAHKDDGARLERGAAVFDDLYEYFKRKPG